MKRILVVLSQSAQVTPAKRDFEESLVAELLMEDGVEVSVIPDLTHLHEDDTGLLCLEGIKGDMILLAWYAPTESHDLLEGHGILGRRGTTTQSSPELPANRNLGPGVYDAMQRTIYCLSLDGAKNTRQIRREIKRISSEAAVATVGLIDLGGPPPAAASPAKPPVAPTVKPAPELDDLSDEELGDFDDREMDDLVDQFDDLDI